MFGKPNFNDLTFDLGEGVVRYGRFITALVNLLIIGTVLFLIVRTAEVFFNRAEKKPTEVELLTEIRDELRRSPDGPIRR